MLEIDETLKLEINTKYPSASKATNKTNHYSLEGRYIVRKLTKQTTGQSNGRKGRPINKESDPHSKFLSNLFNFHPPCYIQRKETKKIEGDQPNKENITF